MGRRIPNLSERHFIFLDTKGRRGGNSDSNDLPLGGGTTVSFPLSILSISMIVFAFEKFTIYYATHWESQKTLGSGYA